MPAVARRVVGFGVGMPASDRAADVPPVARIVGLANGVPPMDRYSATARELRAGGRWRMENAFVVNVKAVVRESDRLHCRFQGHIGENVVENVALGFPLRFWPLDGRPLRHRLERRLGLHLRRLVSSRLCHDSTGSPCQGSAGACSTRSARAAIGSVSVTSSTELARRWLGFVPRHGVFDVFVVVDEVVVAGRVLEVSRL